MDSYVNQDLTSIYELGRMYFETGYLTPAERIFNGLLAVQEKFAPARLGLGAVKLERGLYQEAVVHFKSTLQTIAEDPEAQNIAEDRLSAQAYQLEARLGLALSFLAAGEINRAGTVLAEISKSGGLLANTRPQLKRLFEALVIRCSGASPD